MTKEVVLELDEELIKKLDKQFKELGVNFNEGTNTVLSTFVDDSEGFIVKEPPRKREKTDREPIGNQMTKSIAKNLFERCGYQINKPYTYASRGEVDKTNHDFYWANPNFDCLNEEWSIVLHDKYVKRLTLLRVPEYTFRLENLKRRPDKEVIDLRIECDNSLYRDIASGKYFKDFFVVTINYSDMENPIVIK